MTKSQIIFISLGLIATVWYGIWSSDWSASLVVGLIFVIDLLLEIRADIAFIKSYVKLEAVREERKLKKLNKEK